MLTFQSASGPYFHQTTKAILIKNSTGYRDDMYSDTESNRLDPSKLNKCTIFMEHAGTGCSCFDSI